MWIDGNVTREGITADLEAMQRAGIGGVMLYGGQDRRAAGPGGVRQPGMARTCSSTRSPKRPGWGWK